MSEFFKRKYRAIAIFMSLILVVTVAAGVLALNPHALPTMAVQGANEVEKAAVFDAPKNQNAPVIAPEKPENMEPPESEFPQGTAGPEPVYNFPGNMRGVFLTPGVDFLLGEQTGESTLKAQIDAAIASAKKLTMNSLIIATDFKGQVVYQTAGAPAYLTGFDPVAYAVERLREENMYAYAVFNTAHYDIDNSLPIVKNADSDALNRLSSNLSEFAEKYKLDGILLDGYTNPNTGRSYKTYTMLGGAMGYDNYMRHTPRAVLTTAARAVSRSAPNTQLGLLLDAVWANAAEEEDGSATAAAFTALTKGNTDTKAMLESGMFQFAAVKAYGSLTSKTEPFGVVAQWWANVAAENDFSLYIVQASSRACSEYDGWAAHDQLTKQAIELEGISGLRGVMFNSLARLVEDPKEATTTLIKYYNQEIQAAHILTELAVTKPESTTFTTTEMTVIFTGASDPNSVVTINGEVIKTDASGYFTFQKDLQGGENRFVIFHKEKTVTYNITRLVEIVKDVMPQGTLRAEGSMDITITALAYHDAEVYARINGSTVPMSVDESVVDEADRDSNYKRFSGVYTAPPATTSEQNIGAISVTGSWQGESKTLPGATVIINKRARIEDGVPVVVVADQARTYPPNTLDNIPNRNYYPIPKGAMDYAVGDEITYVKSGTTYKYYVLASGLRVESGDIRATDDYASGNVIQGFTLKVENGFTYFIMPMTQQVSYTFQYRNDSVSVLFHNTVRTPSSKALEQNPLFTNANWSGGNTLELSMLRTGGFMGYKGYYEDGNLVLRFNNPPSSIQNARIAIDPGHGGRDTGALGFLRDYPERVINWAIAGYLKTELESRGATVLMINTSGGMSLEERVARAEQFNADMFISVHNNSALNANAVGTEVYYFYPFSYALANNSSAQVARQLATTNRGAKQSYYHITLSSQFQSVLVECGFVSNKGEYEKLIKSSYQKRIATGIADSVVAAIKASYTGVSGGTTTISEPTQQQPTTGGDAVERVSISGSALSLRSGESATLTATISPTTAKDKTVLWTSSNTAVATVDKNGKVSAVGNGQADIKVTTVDGGYSATARVTVSATGTSGSNTTGASDIFFNDDIYTLKPRNTLTLKLNSDVGYLKAADFKWESSDESLATVSSEGVVTAKTKNGVVTIYAEGYGMGAFCDINITDSTVAVTSIDLSTDYITMLEGTTWSGLEIDISPRNATDREIKWSGGNNRASASGNTISAKTAGVATLTARVASQSADIDIEIIKPSTIDELEITTEAMELYRGDSDKLEAWLEHDIVGDSLFTWSSSSSSVVSVDSNGNIKALKPGTAIITCRLKANTKVYAECEVTVL